MSRALLLAFLGAITLASAQMNPRFYAIPRAESAHPINVPSHLPVAQPAPEEMPSQPSPWQPAASPRLINRVRNDVASRSTPAPVGEPVSPITAPQPIRNPSESRVEIPAGTPFVPGISEDVGVQPDVWPRRLDLGERMKLREERLKEWEKLPKVAGVTDGEPRAEPWSAEERAAWEREQAEAKQLERDREEQRERDKIENKANEELDKAARELREQVDKIEREAREKIDKLEREYADKIGKTQHDEYAQELQRIEDRQKARGEKLPTVPGVTDGNWEKHRDDKPHRVHGSAARESWEHVPLDGEAKPGEKPKEATPAPPRHRSREHTAAGLLSDVRGPNRHAPHR